MNYQEELIEQQKDLTVNTINTRLREVNIQLIDIIEHLTINNKQLEEYKNILEEKICGLETQHFLHRYILDNIKEAVEIFDEQLLVVYQNQASNNELEDAIGKRCCQIYNRQNKNCVIQDVAVQKKSISELIIINDNIYKTKAIPFNNTNEGNKVIVIRKYISTIGDPERDEERS